MLEDKYHFGQQNISPSHRRRLEWFAGRAGQTTPFPGRTDEGEYLVSAPKGIYKAADLKYALSIRIQLRSPYADGRVRTRSDGSWFFSYHQEGVTLADRDRLFTNRGLMACIKDRIPVGVLEEVPPSGGRSQYLVRGLARPVFWENGYFFFESLSGLSAPRGDTFGEVLTREAEEHLEQEENPPGDDYDARRRVFRQIVTRRGQAAFRRKLMIAYSAECAITGCTAEGVLEAAHLRPYRGPQSNTVTNGLLLRSDIHTLLDLNGIAIHPSRRTVHVSKSLVRTEYADLSGRRLREPTMQEWRPAEEALATVWETFRRAEALQAGA